jgi:predicted small lipoprotein YifL
MDKRRRRALTLLLASAAAVVTGCGQKGPLYLPEEKLEELKKKRKLAASPRASKTA